MHIHVSKDISRVFLGGFPLPRVRERFLSARQETRDAVRFLAVILLLHFLRLPLCRATYPVWPRKRTSIRRP